MQESGSYGPELRIPDIGLFQGCQTQFLEGRSPAEFYSNPAPPHKPCSFQMSLKDLDGSGVLN